MSLKEARAWLVKARARLWESIAKRHDAKPGSDRRDELAHEVRRRRRAKDDLAAKVRRLQHNGRRVIPRSEWGAQAPKSAPVPLLNRSGGFFVHHTVVGAPTTESGERAEMRNLQQIAFSRGFNDISYSFIVFQSGRLYEGRGRNAQGAHTLGFNSTALACAAAGNYDNLTPTPALLRSLKWLYRDYLALGQAPCRGHRDVYGTACPGAKLYPHVSSL